MSAMSKEEFQELWQFAESHDLMRVPLDKLITLHKSYKRNKAYGNIKEDSTGVEGREE